MVRAGSGHTARRFVTDDAASHRSSTHVALYVLLTDQVCLWILRRRALATSATWRLQFCRNAAYAVRARVATTMLARNGRKGARSASARVARSVCEAPQMRHARLRLCLSSSPEPSAANQRLLARTLAANLPTQTRTHPRLVSKALSVANQLPVPVPRRATWVPVPMPAFNVAASVSPPPCTRLWCCVCLLSTSQHSTKICA